MFEERPYQTEALEGVLKGFRSHQRQLLVLPTGAGKTITFARLIKDYVDRRKRCLILAHREELLSQAQDKLLRSQSIISDLERASSRAAMNAPCVVGSVQTMYREKRLHRWPSDHFDLIIIDEAHRALASTYRKIIDYFESAHLLGVTATPDRGDRRNLSQVFENIAYEVSLREMIQQRYLAPIRVKTFPIDMDLSKVGMKNGDYDVNDVAHVLEPLLIPIAQAFLKEIKDCKKTLVFLPLRSLSRDFVSILEDNGLSTAHIDGESKDRAEILSRFRDGQIDVLCNAMLLTEGYDEPAIDSVMCLRPTKSRALYSQMIGRGTRTAPGKENLLILDPLWMSETHSLIKPAHLVAQSREDAEAINEELKDPDFIPDIEDEAYDLIEASDNALETRMETIRKRLQEKQKAAAKKFDPITYALNVMDSPSLAEYQPTMGWESAPATAKQIEALKKEGFEPDDITCKGHASKILDSIFKRRDMSLATTKQLFWLHRFKVANANSLTFQEASAELDMRFNGGKSKTSKPRLAKKPKQDFMAAFAKTKRTY